MVKKFWVVFVKPKYKFVPFSWVIRLFQGFTRYSHCEFNFIISNHSMYYGAVNPAVRLTPEYRFEKKYEVIKRFELEVSEEHYKEIRDMIMIYSDAPYPVLESICMGISRLLGLKNNFYYSNENMKCSELLANFINKIAGIDINSEMCDVKDVYLVLDGLSKLPAGSIKVTG